MRRGSRHHLPLTVLLAALGARSALASDFATDVGPVLAARCLGCHGPDKRKGGLRLDEGPAALAGGDSGPVIKPRDSASSPLYRLVAGQVEGELMPPDGKGERLTARELAALRRWIDDGAVWPAGLVLRAPTARRHWAFEAPARPAIPEVKDRLWAKNPIDRFVLAHLEAQGVRPSPAADRHTLARRLSLDLTGLPPSPEEVDAFVADRRPDAIERLVDRLLASPHFGEQWARHWLDLARYADSDGYEKDYLRPHAWRWRNWVVDATNGDQPFDEFTRDQIAGDLVPGATLAQRVATGFHRNTLLNREGGVDVEEDRTKIVVDRVSTVGQAWLGLTVGCAECHSHKYDPITQQEFYRLYAFFNSVDDRDIPAPLAAQDASALAGAKAAYVAAAEPALDSWAARIAALPDVWHTPAVGDYELPTFGANNGANLYPQEDGSFLVTGMVEGKTHYVMMLNTKLDGITGVRVEAMTDEMLPALGPGHAPDGRFVLTEVTVEAAPAEDVTRLRRQRLAGAVADAAEPGFPAAAAIDGDADKGGWAVLTPGLPAVGVDRAAVFILSEPLRHRGRGLRLKVNLVQHEGRSRSLGRLRVSYTTASPATLGAQAVPQRIRDLARLPAARRSVDDKAELKRYFQATYRPDAPALRAYASALLASPDVKGTVRAPVIVERARPRPTHVHVRGNFLERGARVTPGTLSALHPFSPRDPRRADRLDLARWLTDRTNPLTARVMVNHVWQHLFGEGLVSTPGDFGTQGDPPSHPALLDWLATELVGQGWSRKALIKLIVTSATYQQSSATRPDLRARDAHNRWLARQNRFRLSAENVRDQFLASSGLLDRAVGGASVDPQVPRRGMYLRIKRSQLDAMLGGFDAPASTQACTRRERSNTPLQALMLLNDDLFVDAARALAQRAVSAAGDERGRLEHAFRLALARPPGPDEARDLQGLRRRARQVYDGDPGSARTLVRDAWPGLPAAEAAAWIVVARTILNLDELVTRQ